MAKEKNSAKYTDIGNISSKKRKLTIKRFVLYIFATLFSIIFILSGSALIYVDSAYLGSINREEILGMSSVAIEDLEIEHEKIPVNSDGTYDIPKSDLKGLELYQQNFIDVQSIPKIKSEHVRTYLLIGSDSRTSSFAGRSDSMILFSVNTQTKEINMTSLQRVCYVCTPDGYWGALNAVYAKFGANALVETIEGNFRLEIDGYLVVNFQNFESIINLAGGVDINLTSAEASHLNNKHGYGLSSGYNHLTGSQALDYARIRYIDNDFVRTSRQQTVIEQLFKKALTLNPSQLNNLAIGACKLVNTNISGNELVSLSLSIPNYASYNMSQILIPLQNDNSYSSSVYKNKIYVYQDGFKMEMYKIDYENDIKTLHNYILNGVDSISNLKK